MYYYKLSFNSQLAEEAGHFTLQDVINDVTEKMIHRHPNVFPEENPDNKGKHTLGMN